MKIAIVGCAHGELQNIYDSIQFLQERDEIKIDLLICCGDFQASRNKDDLLCMAVPPKYQKICTFYKFYSGERTAPVLTIFIGGNHEASNYLQELPYGGWVAPNIYYMGYANVINIGGLRIAGLSGIYKERDYLKGHYEKVPYDENSKRTVYHIRNLDIYRLKQLSGKIDIFLSHDWPTNIAQFGNLAQLLKKKPYFKEDIKNKQLGSQPCEELLHLLKPAYWFSAHLHCKYAAIIKHEDSVTKFLALDKCLPKRKFLQIVDIPHNDDSKLEISYDVEWLSILFLTNHLLSVKNQTTYMPGPGCSERHIFTPTEEEKRQVLLRMNNELKLPKNFVKTAQPFRDGSPKKSVNSQPTAKLNSQTVQFCEKLAIDDPVVLIAETDGISLTLGVDDSIDNTTFIDDTLNDSGTSDSFPTKKMSNLSLPEPKVRLSEGSQNNTKANSEGESESSAKSSDEISDEPVTNTKLPPNSSFPKKFNRRNEKIYTKD